MHLARYVEHPIFGVGDDVVMSVEGWGSMCSSGWFDLPSFSNLFSARTDVGAEMAERFWQFLLILYVQRKHIRISCEMIR